MKHLLDDLCQYDPTHALIIYACTQPGIGPRVESCRIDQQGRLLAAHPLTVQEAAGFSEALRITMGTDRFLCPEGILPTTVLHLKTSANGFAVWYTPASKQHLLFDHKLSIPNHVAQVPAMLWKASASDLWVFALDSDQRPCMDTVLYHAPFHNIYEDGTVCMGTVQTQLEQCDGLEDFMRVWEQYFFGSYFTHILGDNTSIDHITPLWRELAAAPQAFPVKKLQRSKIKIETLL